MTETAQPTPAAESEVASDPIADAANAFKTFTDAAPAEDRPRDEQGRFARTAEQIEAEDDGEPAGEAEAEAESHDDAETDEAADEAQPEAVDLPTSWPSEHAETWKSLPPETQALIVEREGQRDAAVNAKFQEAANVKKANEALIAEANTNRQQFAEAADFVMSLVAPQKPSPTMLNPQSGDYNPDAYHLAMAQYEQTSETLRAVQQHRQQAIAQQEAEAQSEREQRIAALNEKAMPELTKAVPAFAEGGQAAEQAFMDIARYALEQGVPAETSLSDFTAVELLLLHKAREFDKMMAAKGKVQPKAAKPAAPPVRPGVTTPKGAIEQSKRKQAHDRLAREGSIEAGAAIFKDYFKGK
jgi:hypothetical protein